MLVAEKACAPNECIHHEAGLIPARQFDGKFNQVVTPLFGFDIGLVLIGSKNPFEFKKIEIQSR